MKSRNSQKNTLHNTLKTSGQMQALPWAAGVSVSTGGVRMPNITPVWRSYRNVQRSLPNSVATGQQPSSVPASNDMTYQENWDFSVKRLRAVAEILKDHGHSLGLEFIGPATSRKSAKHLFAYSMDAMLGLAAAIGTGNVGLLFDTWHWYTCRSTVDDVRKLSVSDVVYVHINDAPAGIDPDDQIDNIRCLPAETGVIPLTELMQILTEIGYEGPVTPEPFSKAVNEMEPADAAKANRRIAR